MTDKALATRAETKYFHFTATGLVVEGEPPFKAWEAYGHVLGKIKDGCAWSIGDWVNYGEERYGEKYSQAIEVTGRSEGGLRNLASVAARFELSRRRDNLGWSIHAEVAGLDPARADALLDEAAASSLTREDVRAKVREARYASRTTLRAWPPGKRGLIYVDPPWKPDAGVLDPTRQIENQYPTLPIDEIIALTEAHVRAIAADDCLLACWVTAQKVTEYALLVDAWGFEHKSGAVWVKDTIGMGYYFRQRHELLMVATKGQPATPLEQARPDSVIERPRRGHSVKPDLYAMLDVMFPGVPKIELFARENPARPADWATWGDEAVGPRLVEAAV